MGSLQGATSLNKTASPPATRHLIAIRSGALPILLGMHIEQNLLGPIAYRLLFSLMFQGYSPSLQRSMEAGGQGGRSHVLNQEAEMAEC